ncbi:hypothetical protein [Pseudolysinimonas sp.]|uniref:hypothetical protein n=1 Tax=Pseudolysinimonas sp. TaxID=2680009 RepID=UPI003F7DDB51
MLSAIDDELRPIVHGFGIAQQAVTAALSSSGERSAEAVARIGALKADRGWRTHETNPGELIAARVVEAFERIGRPDLVSLLPAYAEAAELVAHADLTAVAAVGPAGLTRMVETVVVGTALGDSLFTGLRRIAQEHAARRLGLPGSELDSQPDSTDAARPAATPSSEEAAS